MKVKVQTLDAGKGGGDIELNDEIFAVEPRADILHRVVTWQLTNLRAPARAARARTQPFRTVWHDSPHRDLARQGLSLSHAKAGWCLERMTPGAGACSRCPSWSASCPCST